MNSGITWNRPSHSTMYPTISCRACPTPPFTEALAFLFQKRDLEVLGFKNTDPSVENMKTLDICWSTFEIMGVGMVDMQMWKWMYDNPDATPEQLKEQTIDHRQGGLEHLFRRCLWREGRAYPGHLFAHGQFTAIPLGVFIRSPHRVPAWTVHERQGFRYSRLNGSGARGVLPRRYG